MGARSKLKTYHSLTHKGYAILSAFGIVLDGVQRLGSHSGRVRQHNQTNCAQP